MKESIGKQIYEFLTLDRYLLLVGFPLLLVGIVLFVFCIMLDIPILRVETMSNPLFYLILGIVVLVFRCFIRITDKDIILLKECE